jgi:hypothetical protein
MTIKHFCHVCNANFHRAVDFISHTCKEIKAAVEYFTPEDKKENDRM